MRQVVMFVLIVLFLLGTWHLAEAVDLLKAYDTFEVGPISPDRWNGSTLGDSLYEGNRTIVVDPSGVGRDLRILNRSYARTDSNIGLTFGSYGLTFKNPGSVTAIRARVQALSVLSRGCSLNALPTLAIAQLIGFFFNASVSTPGNATDDIIAGVAVRRLSNSLDPANVLEVTAFVQRCTDPNCLSGPIRFMPLGKVTVGLWVRLLVQWDPDNDRFIFQRGSEALQFVSYVGLGGDVTDSAPPGSPSKRIGVDNFVPNCTDAVRPAASMNALFDNVFVNQTPIP